MMENRASATRHEPDYLLLLGFVALLLFGLTMLISASAPVGYSKFGDSYFFIKRQLLFGFVPGIIAFFFFAKLDYHILKKYRWPIFFVSLASLVCVFIPGIGSRLGTAAHSWIVLGPFSFQPSEFAKLATIIFLASFLADKGVALHDFQRGFVPTLGLACLPLALILLQPDVGTASIFFAIILGMLWIGGADAVHMIALLATGAAGFAIMIAVAPYRAARFMTFLHPELDPKGVGYHINQAFMAIGSGGWFGLGLGHSRQKFQYLPEVNADSIFAVIAEEMGFVVVVAFLGLLMFLLFRALQAAKHAPDAFGRFLAAGIIIWLTIQAFCNIAAMAGLMPLTGVPLPFVSHGGTALFLNMAAVGMLINVSKYHHV